MVMVAQEPHHLFLEYLLLMLVVGAGVDTQAVMLAGMGGVGGGGNARFTPTAGTTNTGGGGGGLTGNAGGNPGAAGGSGIVILKYLVPVGTTVTHIYKGSGSWVAPEGVTAIDWLVVAGGGSGGSMGGGGAGGYRTGTGLSVTAGNTYTITVGGGGPARVNPSEHKTALTHLLLAHLYLKTPLVLVQIH
jgi:hypothetical protein